MAFWSWPWLLVPLYSEINYVALKDAKIRIGIVFRSHNNMRIKSSPCIISDVLVYQYRISSI